MAFKGGQCERKSLDATAYFIYVYVQFFSYIPFLLFFLLLIFISSSSLRTVYLIVLLSLPPPTLPSSLPQGCGDEFPSPFSAAYNKYLREKANTSARQLEEVRVGVPCGVEVAA